jgi:hypothetical protein
MSFFQPLIATAFSNYAYRSSFLYRDADASVSGVAGKEALSETGKTREVAGVRKSERTTDADAGKIKSSFGDVLDISDAGKAALESLDSKKISDSNVDSNELTTSSNESEADVSDADARDSNVETESKPKTFKDGGTGGAGEAKASSESEAEELNAEDELTAEEEEQVQKLKERDAEVRQHEQAHLSAAGQYANGAPEYTYQTGPDGKKYAIGGSVSIDVSAVDGDPEATIAKMQQVAAAATAPAEPSSQDLKVAAAAKQKEAQARMELAKQRSEESAEINNSNKTAESENTESKNAEAKKAEPNNSNKINYRSQSISAASGNLTNAAVASAYMSQSTLSSNSARQSINIFA